MNDNSDLVVIKEEETDISSFNQNQVLKRTNFFISVVYLLFQVIIPGLTVYFLTSRDFAFSFVLPFWLMLVLALSLILFTIISTFVVYKLKGHQLDQFTYSLPFICFIIGLYLSGYWLDYHYFLVRFIIAFIFAVIGVFFTSLILLLCMRKKRKQEVKY